jgi:hypothetical protein
MKTIPVYYRGDLYRVTLDIMNEVVSIEMCLGTENRPFSEVPVEEVPDAVKEKATSKAYDE